MSLTTIATVIITLGSVCAAILGIIKFGQKMITDPIVSRIEKKIDERVDPIVETQKDAQLRLLRLEILNLVHNDPNNLDTILNTFDEYKGLGGNHYIDAVITRWKKSQGID